MDDVGSMYGAGHDLQRGLGAAVIGEELYGDVEQRDAFDCNDHAERERRDEVAVIEGALLRRGASEDGGQQVGLCLCESGIDARRRCWIDHEPARGFDGGAIRSGLLLYLDGSGVCDERYGDGAIPL